MRRLAEDRRNVHGTTAVMTGAMTGMAGIGMASIRSSVSVLGKKGKKTE